MKAFSHIFERDGRKWPNGPNLILAMVSDLQDKFLTATFTENYIVDIRIPVQGYIAAVPEEFKDIFLHQLNAAMQDYLGVEGSNMLAEYRYTVLSIKTLATIQHDLVALENERQMTGKDTLSRVVARHFGAVIDATGSRVSMDVMLRVPAIPPYHYDVLVEDTDA